MAESGTTLIALGGLALVFILGVVFLKRAGWPMFKKTQPGDYEAELIRLCRGNRAKAEKHIQEIMARSPELSRVGAAMAAVTRIRHEKDGYPSPL